jgi:hypothetical protein
MTQKKGQAESAQGYCVRLTKADGTVTLWFNTGRARAVEIYERERAAAAAGDEVEWGTGDGECDDCGEQLEPEGNCRHCDAPGLR